MVAPPRKMVHGAREKFFAGAARPQQEHGGISGGDALHLRRGFLHAGMFAYDARESIAYGVFFAQQNIFPQQLLLSGGSADEKFK